MLVLSPPLFSTTYRWPLEDFVTQNLQQDCHDISLSVEENAYPSLINIPTFDHTQHDFAPSSSISYGGAVNGDIGNPIKVAKKLNHNASERDRRKRVNELYAFLCSLLPISSDQKKKVSIPGIVSHALKYIPKLQKEVKTLMHKKEKLLSYSSPKHLDIRNHSAKEAMIQTVPSVVSSVSVLDEKETVIQLISSTGHMNKNKEIDFLSKALEYLEEVYGLVLLNATTFEWYGDKKFLNTLHLQMQGDQKIEAEKLKEKLCSFYQQYHELSL
ncbi:transcription factor ORG2-like [Cynara cardunculus var. scolymus]|uniref:Achaete-scute transcription factor-related protein n=1 Tax=Cynara cardunculus var. scolymus TaxID=59895 RepID=A0A124SFJ7_CYNCS|nr:transcription factor ORG2-like [Cynara cardunculus var. scolymus]KVI03451.1 Achaete-scute transcription factor-related protein [Cynara cardunculus var. scolymus]